MPVLLFLIPTCTTTTVANKIFEKVIFFRQSDSPGESICKNAQFLQWILKDDDVYFKKITES